MRSGIPDQGAAGLERRMQPFVRIERDGIGALDAGDAIGVLGGDGDERADAAIDMEPEVFLRRQASRAPADRRLRRCLRCRPFR